MNTQVPDLVDPVLGWRVWRVATTPGGARLTSLTRPVHWPTRAPIVAACAAAHADPAPVSPCGCGIWALRSLNDVARLTVGPPQTAAFLVVGQVRLWGRVVEGSGGWRASHAYPHRLALLPPRAATLEEQFGVAFDLAAYAVPIEIPSVLRAPVSGAVLPTAPAPDDPAVWPFHSTTPPALAAGSGRRSAPGT